MKNISTFIVLLILFSPKLTYAGAWGVGSFENDSALDWFSEIEQQGNLNSLQKSFEASNINGHLDLDICSAVLAASEIVLSIKTKDYSHLPANVKNWTMLHIHQFNGSYLSNAVIALDRCSDIKNSEIADLWAHSAEWNKNLKDLRMKLK